MAQSTDAFFKYIMKKNMKKRRKKRGGQKMKVKRKKKGAGKRRKKKTAGKMTAIKLGGKRLSKKRGGKRGGKRKKSTKTKPGSSGAFIVTSPVTAQPGQKQSSLASIMKTAARTKGYLPTSRLALYQNQLHG